MIVTLQRQRFTTNETVGELFVGTTAVITIEPSMRSKSLLPSGIYALSLDNSSEYFKDLMGMLYGDGFHHGMLMITDSPGTIICLGRSVKDTVGSILVGLSEDHGVITESMDAYRIIYPMIVDSLLRGDETMIDISNGDQS